MALVKEDGSRVAGANSYADLTDFSAYFTDRDDADALALSDDAVTAGLIRATAWIDGTVEFRGGIVATTQPRAWPRSGAVDDEGREVLPTAVPVEVVHATLELARDDALGQKLNSSKSTGDGLKSLGLGEIDLVFRPGYVGERVREFVDALLARWSQSSYAKLELA